MKKRKPYIDPVVAAYMRDIDRTLLRKNLKLTPAERLEKLVRFSRFAGTQESRATCQRSKFRLMSAEFDKLLPVLPDTRCLKFKAALPDGAF